MPIRIPNASRSRVRGADLDRLVCQSDQCGGPQDTHLVEGGEEQLAGPTSFRQDLDLAGHAPAGERQSAHIRTRVVRWSDGAPRRPIALEREHDVGHGPIRQDPIINGTGRVASETMPAPFSASSSRLAAPQAVRSRAAAAGSAKGTGRNPTADFFGNQSELEEPAPSPAHVLGHAHPHGAGGDEVGPQVGVMAEGLGARARGPDPLPWRRVRKTSAGRTAGPL